MINKQINNYVASSNIRDLRGPDMTLISNRCLDSQENAAK